MSGKNILGKNFTKGKAIILCFILVLVAASVTMSPILLAGPGYRVRVPDFSVNMVETYPGTVTHSYFGTTLSGIGGPGAGYDVYDGLFVGWCCDEQHYIYPGTLYSVRLYSTYNPSMPWPDPEGDWDMVNYLLNHKVGTANQIQSAIWYFIDGGYFGSDLIIKGMIDDAIAHGEGFVPQQGEICAVLCDAGTGIQHTFIEVFVPPPPCTVYVDDDYTTSTPDWGYDHFAIIQDGVDAVCDGGIVYVHDGTYSPFIVESRNNIIITRASNPIITGNQQVWDMSYPAKVNNIVFVNNSVNIDIIGFDIIGTNPGGQDFTVFYQSSSGSIQNCLVNANNIGNMAALAVRAITSSDLTIDNCTVQNYGRIAVYAKDGTNLNVFDSTLIGHIYTTADGDYVNYGIEIEGINLPCIGTITGNEIYNHDYIGSPSWTSSGILVDSWRYYGPSYNCKNSTVTIEENNIHNNMNGLEIVANANIHAHCNNISDNTLYGAYSSSYDDGTQILYDTLDATCNWWGAANGPGPVGPGTGDSVSANVVYDPWVGFVIADANGPYTSNNIGVVHFDGSDSNTSDCCDETVSYDWDFGDESPHGSGVNPTHQYTIDDTYIVTLTVTVNACGHSCQDIDQTNVITCFPNLVVNKTVWNGSYWVDDIRVPNGSLLNFSINIKNAGNCPLNGITITDYLSSPQLKYNSSSTAPVSASDHTVIWTTSIGPGETKEINYTAWTVHVCYGWNSVYVTDSDKIGIGSDLTNVKVLSNENQPEVDITKQVWDENKNIWSDHITVTPNKELTFKITVNSTALSTVHNVIVTDILPSLVTYNDGATPTPDSESPNKVIWHLGDMSPGDVQEITYNVLVLEMGTAYNTANVTSAEGHYDEDYVLLEIDAAPSMNLIYPEGGETLKGTATIKWYAHDAEDGDNLPIYIYFKDVSDTLYTAFTGNPYLNTGELNWATTSLPDGSYQLQIVTEDSNNNIGSDTSQFQIKNHEAPPLNLPPNKPSTPTGTANGKPGVEYLYTSSTTDPDGDQVYYLWDWGDGNNSGWFAAGPYSSGATMSARHKWTVKGSYSIKVKAKDIYGKESSWSDPLPITMPYSFNNPILHFLELLFQRFPHAFPILRHLLGY